MRIALTGRDSAALLPLVREMGFQLDEVHPEAVVTYGGDGTFLMAEFQWPGIPKLAIRHDATSTKCPDHQNTLVLQRLAKGEVPRTRLIKLAGSAKGRRILAINDVTLNRTSPVMGVRYRVWINDEPYSGEIVGDGLVAATPFGSTAYYRSITRSFFRTGIGVAFNNSTEQVDHLMLRETDRLRLVVTRGPAVLCGDNSPLIIELKQGEEAAIAKAEESAALLAADTLFCKRCLRADGTPFNRLGGLQGL